jgi:hypothetical protein
MPETQVILGKPIVVPTLDGVTTAIVAFIFVCLIYQNLVKNRPQYYGAVIAVLFVILLHSLSVMIGSVGFNVFAGALTGLAQVVAIVLLILCVGGMSVKELAGDLGKAYEVIRRGETEKEIIVPLTGERTMPREPAPPPAYTVNPPPNTEPAPMRPDNAPLPVEDEKP